MSAVWAYQEKRETGRNNKPPKTRDNTNFAEKYLPSRFVDFASWEYVSISFVLIDARVRARVEKAEED